MDDRYPYGMIELLHYVELARPSSMHPILGLLYLFHVKKKVSIVGVVNAQ